MRIAIRQALLLSDFAVYLYWKYIIEKQTMVKTKKTVTRGAGGVAYSKTKKVKNKSAVSVSPEKSKGIFRTKKLAGRNSGSLIEQDPFDDYIHRNLDGKTFNDEYCGMLVPMVFEIVSECVSCVLLVPLNPRKKTADARAYLNPATTKLFPDWYGTVTVQGNNSKEDGDGELMHKMVEMLPVEGTPKFVGKATKYYSYIFAFAVNHSDMEKEVREGYIVSVAQKFG
jgi:hypothetical protein